MWYSVILMFFTGKVWFKGFFTKLFPIFKWVKVSNKIFHQNKEMSFSYRTFYGFFFHGFKRPQPNCELISVPVSHQFHHPPHAPSIFTKNGCIQDRDISPNIIIAGFPIENAWYKFSKLRAWLFAKMLHDFLMTWWKCSSLWAGTCQLLVIKTEPPKTFSCLKQRQCANIWWFFLFFAALWMIIPLFPS